MPGDMGEGDRGPVDNCLTVRRRGGGKISDFAATSIFESPLKVRVHFSLKIDLGLLYVVE